MPENKRKKPKKSTAKKRQKATEKPCQALIVLGRPVKRRQISMSWLRKRFIQEYERTLGNISASCQNVGIHRATIYRWLKSNSRINQKFRTALEAVNPIERKRDFIEEKFLELVNDKNPTVIVHAAKTILKERGYGDKPDTTETDTELALLKNKIKARALQRGVSFAAELETYLEIFGQDIRPEIKEELTGKYIN